MPAHLAICPKCARPISRGTPQGLCPVCLASSLLELMGEAAEEDMAPMPAPAAPSERVGDYELLEELGRGGMGVVFRARDRRLHRLIALKLILSGRLASEAEVKRFRNEAEAAAHLEHPHIVPIYEVGECGGRHYFVMKLVEGGALSERISNLQSPISNGEAAKLITTVARAVHHAHQRGILHRDLKPGNILLNAAGEPLVADFGLAKFVVPPSGGSGAPGPARAGTANALTLTGAVVGSPSYMAPEQASGGSRAVTTAADIYSLGAILYELLAGRPPFVAATPLETLRKAMEEEPVPPSHVRRSRRKEAHAPQNDTPSRNGNQSLLPSAATSVDRDLETICLKCLRKDPRQRYATAEALAEDLERWLRHEPIQARPTGDFERAVKWIRRRPLHAALLGVSVLAIVLFALQARRGEHRVTHERNTAQTNQLRAELAERATRTNLYAADIFFAHGALAQHGYGDAYKALAGHRPAPGQADVRDWEWRWLWHRLPGDESRILRGHTGLVHTVAFSPDGRLVASGGSDATARLWDTASGEELARFPFIQPLAEMMFPLQRGANVLATRGMVTFSPDGQFLGLAEPIHLSLWHVPTRTRRWATNANFPQAEFLPELPVRLVLSHRWLGSAGPPNQISFLDAAGQPVRAPWTNAAAEFFALSADGRWLAERRPQQPGEICIRQVPEGEIVLRFTPPGHGPFRLALSPDGQMLAVCRNLDFGVHLFDARSGQPVGRLEGHEAPVYHVAFSPDGKFLASAGQDETVRLWDPATRTERRQFRGHQLGVRWVAFARDGQTLASAGHDGTVRLWPVAPPPAPAPMSNCGGPLAFSHDGRWLATPYGSNQIAVWECATRQRRATTERLGRPTVLMFPRGEKPLLIGLINAAKPPSVLQFDPASGTVGHRFRFPPLDSRAKCLAFSPDARLCATGHEDGRLRWWAGRTGEPLGQSQVFTQAVQGLRFSADGRHLLAWSPYPRILTSWRTDTRELLATNWLTWRTAMVLAFAPDGDAFATGGAELDVKFWSLHSLDRVGSLPDERDYTRALAWSPGGKTLVRCTGSGQVRLWHLPTGRPLFTLAEGLLLEEMAFSPEGQWLGGVDGNREVHLWHGPPDAP